MHYALCVQYVHCTMYIAHIPPYTHIIFIAKCILLISVDVLLKIIVLIYIRDPFFWEWTQ